MNLSDFSLVYGSNPNLTGIRVTQPYNRSGDAVVHGVGHSFSAFLDDPRLPLTSGSHWKNMSDTPMGVMDMGRGMIGYPLLSKSPEGVWAPTIPETHNMVGSIETRGYSMLDLYLAEMAYAHEVPGFHINLSDLDPFQHELHSLDYVDSARIISVYGERSPPYDGKTLDWTMLTVVVTEGELPPSVAAFYNHRNRYLMSSHTYEPGSIATTVISVPDACRGRCTFDTKVPRP